MTTEDVKDFSFCDGGWVPDIPSVLKCHASLDICKKEKTGRVHPECVEGKLLLDQSYENFGSEFLLDEHAISSLGNDSIYACATFIELALKQHEQTPKRLSRQYSVANIPFLKNQSIGRGTLRATLTGFKTIGIPPKEIVEKDKRLFKQKNDRLFEYIEEAKQLEFGKIEEPNETMCHTLKKFLFNNVPILFGFAVPENLTLNLDEEYVDELHYTSPESRIIGGSAGVLCGFDDKRDCYRHRIGTRDQAGAFVFQSVWGNRWGYNGFGYIAYEDVEKGYAQDFWVCNQIKDLIGF